MEFRKKDIFCKALSSSSTVATRALILGLEEKRWFASFDCIIAMNYGWELYSFSNNDFYGDIDFFYCQYNIVSSIFLYLEGLCVFPMQHT